jgi:hypothetical protein
MDTYVAAQTSPYVGPMTDPGVTMAVRRNYNVTVAGAVSLWARTSWRTPRFHTCGRRKDKPQFPSPGISNSGPTGADAVGFFAFPTDATCPPTMPQARSNLQISTNGGVTFYHPADWTNIPGSTKYYLTVAGGGFPLQTRYYDPVASDNYGRFRVQVTKIGK